MTEGMGRAHYYFFKWWTFRSRSKATITVLFDLRHLSFVLKPAAGVIIAVTKWRGGSVLFFNDLLASCSNDLLFHFSIEKIRSSIRWKGAFSYHESVRTFSLPWLPSPYTWKKADAEMIWMNSLFYCSLNFVYQKASRFLQRIDFLCHVNFFLSFFVCLCSVLISLFVISCYPD